MQIVMFTLPDTIPYSLLPSKFHTFPTRSPVHNWDIVVPEDEISNNLPMVLKFVPRWSFGFRSHRSPRIHTTRDKRTPTVQSQRGNSPSLCAAYPSVSGQALRVLARNFSLVIVFTSGICLVH